MANFESTRVEVCVASLNSAHIAQVGGAHRIELNSALALGGLTPSLGLLQSVKDHVQLPVIAMVRPRESGFNYSDREFSVMCRDIELLLKFNADGVAVGFLDGSGQIERRRCRQVRELVGAKELVFHRAFDLIHDQTAALESLVDLGFDRVLTSGGAAGAEQGIPRIQAMVQRAGDRIEVLAGGGIRASNARKIVRETGVDQIHGTFSHLARDATAVAPTRIQEPSSTPGNGIIPPHHSVKRASFEPLDYAETDPDVLAQTLRQLSLDNAP